MIIFHQTKSCRSVCKNDTCQSACRCSIIRCRLHLRPERFFTIGIHNPDKLGLKEEGSLIRKAVDASLDACVRTPEIQVEGGAVYGTREVGQWIVDYLQRL